MRITESSDWRDSLPFDKPVPLAEVVPGDPAKCAGCPVGAPLHPRDELWAVKHRHPTQHGGFVRFYCALHVPEAAPAPAVQPTVAVRPARRTAERRPAAPRVSRPTPAAERPRAVCPNCFIEVPPTGVCGNCGTLVA